VLINSKTIISKRQSPISNHIKEAFAMFLISPPQQNSLHAHARCPKGPCRFVVRTTCGEDRKEQTPSDTKTAEAHGDKTDAKAMSRILMERSPVHCQETPERAVLALDVTGFSLQDIQIQLLEDHVVSISGKRENRLGDTYMISRRFRLDKSTADEANIHASLSDGILEIIVPKRAKVGPRTIPISTIAAPVVTACNTDENSEKQHQQQSHPKPQTTDDEPSNENAPQEE
jgi:HSP20 family molecular chaperone IbpA